MTPFCPLKGAPNDAEECKSRLRATDLISKPPATEIRTILRLTQISLDPWGTIWKNNKLEAHQTIVWRYKLFIHVYTNTANTLYTILNSTGMEKITLKASNDSLDLNKDWSFQWNSPVELIAKLLCCPRSIGKPSRTPPKKKTPFNWYISSVGIVHLVEQILGCSAKHHEIFGKGNF